MIMKLADLKKDYSVLAAKYKLPKFAELNEDFEVEKCEKESETLLRVIRKVMMEKIISSLGFVEMLLNPMNAPRMYLSYIHGMGADDKKSIEKIYTAFADISAVALECEIDYSEKNEAELIRSIFDTWQKMKLEFRKILTHLKAPSLKVEKVQKSYFG